jgi:hypothetical protein
MYLDRNMKIDPLTTGRTTISPLKSASLTLLPTLRIANGTGPTGSKGVGPVVQDLVSGCRLPAAKWNLAMVVRQPDAHQCGDA